MPDVLWALAPGSVSEIPAWDPPSLTCLGLTSPAAWIRLSRRGRRQGGGSDPVPPAGLTGSGGAPILGLSQAPGCAVFAGSLLCGGQRTQQGFGDRPPAPPLQRGLPGATLGWPCHTCCPLQAEGITAGGEIARTDPTGWVSPGDVTRAGSSLLTFRSDKCGGWGSAITPGAALPHRPESPPSAQSCPVGPPSASVPATLPLCPSWPWARHPPSPALSSPFLMLAEVLWSSG